VKLTTHIHLALKLRIGRAMPSLYVFMEWYLVEHTYKLTF